jgi:hypothetical protein
VADPAEEPKEEEAESELDESLMKLLFNNVTVIQVP